MTPLPPTSRRTPFDLLPPRLRTFARYFVAGGLATIAHYAILTSLVELAAVDATLATAIGYFLSSVGHYLLCYHWAFRSSARHARATVRFAAVAGSTLLLNTGLFWLLHEAAGLWYVAAQVITTGLLLLVNFALNSRFTFAAR